MRQKDSAGTDSLANLAALGKVFEEHQPRLLEVIRRRIDPALAARIDAEGILAEAYVAARRKWADFRARGTMREYPWLYRIALDCLIEAWRRESRQCRSPARELGLPEQSSIHLGLSLVQPGDGPRTEAGRNELCRRMQQALELLKEKDREVLWMRHYDQLSFAEIGEVLDITENAATVRYVRALGRLKALWHKLHPGEVGP